MPHMRCRRVIALAVSVLALCTSTSGAGQLPPATRCDGCTVDSVAGRSAWTVFENERVLVEGRHYPPGQRTDPPGASHAETVPRDVIIILLTAGEVEINTTGTDARTGHFEAGTSWWWPKPPATHAIANVGTAPFDFLKISLK